MSEPVLRAEFLATLDERVDVTCRCAEMLPSVRSRRLGTIVTTLLIAAVATFGSMRLLAPQRSMAVQAASTAAATAVFAAFAPRWWRRTYRSSVRRAVVDLTGTEPGTVVIELRDEHVLVATERTTTTVPWRDLHTVRDAGDDVEIAGPTTLIVARGRAFADAAARARFRDAAQRLVGG